MMMDQFIFNILLAEDDDGDFELFKEQLLENSTHPYTLSRILDGEDVLPYLEKGALLPDVIILDINMPRMNGHEVIETLKAHADFSNIPIFALTTSSATRDVEMARLAGALGYGVKPGSFSVEDILQSIQNAKLQGKSYFTQLKGSI